MYLLDSCILIKKYPINGVVPAEIYAQLTGSYYADPCLVNICYYKHTFVTLDKKLARNLSAWGFHVLHPKEISNIVV